MTLKVGLIGCGHIARFHSRNIRDVQVRGLVDIGYHAVCDRDIGRAEAFGGIAGCALITDEPADVIEQSRRDLLLHRDRGTSRPGRSHAVHRDPATGAFNAMFPRSGVLNRNEMVTSYVTPTAGKFLAGHKATGKKMPQAMVIGAHPAWELAACYSYPHEGWGELELFEAITGVVVEVVPCKTVDLVVPADASIVIEGYVNPGRTAQDGPNRGPNMLYCPYILQMPAVRGDGHYDAKGSRVSPPPGYALHGSPGKCRVFSTKPSSLKDFGPWGLRPTTCVSLTVELLRSSSSRWNPQWTGR